MYNAILISLGGKDDNSWKLLMTKLWKWTQRINIILYKHKVYISEMLFNPAGLFRSI